jgi:hypothetical protein
MLLPVLCLFLLIACAVGVVRPFISGATRWHFALAACALLVLLIVTMPNGDDAGEGVSRAPLPFLFLLLACLVGVAYPYIPRSKRWHFALGAFASFVGMAVVIPEPTPEQLAARKAREAEDARRAAIEDHEKVVEKAQPALGGNMTYTQAEYGDTFDRVGAATFAKLGDLEPGAAYAAAESKSCNRVNVAMVSDTSKRGAAVWFVDCANERRFMVTQQQAEEALTRHAEGKLALRELAPSCTLSTIADCQGPRSERSAVEEIAKDREIEFVSACDIILQQVVVSPSSLDMHRWRYGLDGNTVVVERPFDSQNGFGAMIRSSYRCEIDAITTNIDGFSVRGPTGSQRVI